MVNKQNRRDDSFEDLNDVDAVNEGGNRDGDSPEVLLAQSVEPSHGSKRSRDDELMDPEAKRTRNSILENGNKAQPLTDNNDVTAFSELNNHLAADADYVQPLKVAPASQKTGEKFYCTACGKSTVSVYQHPLLKVISCEQCKCALEKRMMVSCKQIF